MESRRRRRALQWPIIGCDARALSASKESGKQRHHKKKNSEAANKSDRVDDSAVRRAFASAWSSNGSGPSHTDPWSPEVLEGDQGGGNTAPTLSGRESTIRMWVCPNNGPLRDAFRLDVTARLD